AHHTDQQSEEGGADDESAGDHSAPRDTVHSTRPTQIKNQNKPLLNLQGHHNIRRWQSCPTRRRQAAKRVFNITMAELSFLSDFFYSRHALLFANGFPFLRLFLSSLLVGAIAYMAVAIKKFSKIATFDELSRVHHGVVFTWILLSLLGAKEMIEIYGYVFSDWTKVLLVCNYVRHPWWLRGPVMEMIVRLLCRHSPAKRWHGRIGQYNLVSESGVPWSHTSLPEHVQEALLLSLRSLQRNGNPAQDSYLDKAFSAALPAAAELREQVHAKVDGLKGDVQRVLLWHIATCYCQIHLALADRRRWWVRIPGIWTRLFVKRPELGDIEKHHVTATRLSQYCAHALRLRSPLIPGNDIITAAVLDRVIKETRKALKRCRSIQDKFAKLQEMVHSQNDDQGSRDEARQNVQGSLDNTSAADEARQNDHASPPIEARQNDQGSPSRNNSGDESRKNDQESPRPGDTLLLMGSELGQILIDATSDKDRWAFLAQLWAGFVLHLAESTRASQHKIYLSTGGELMTHLWALLSHAGLMGDVKHGETETGTAATPFQEAQREALDIQNPIS
ncbi:hypothetical protein U9M48_009225, partial [Paspalum notatum var. saurae]